MSNRDGHGPLARAWEHVKDWPIIGSVLRYLHALLRLPRIHMGVLVLEDKVSELQRRQTAFENDQLPALVRTVSDVNSRVLARDQDSENLLASLPAQLRSIRRDISGLVDRLTALQDEWSEQFETVVGWQAEFRDRQLPIFVEQQRRQTLFEDEQLPILVRTLAEMNCRLLAAEQDMENLSLSLPPQVREIRREMSDTAALIQATEKSVLQHAGLAISELQSRLDASQERMDQLAAQLRSTETRAQEADEIRPTLSEVVRRQKTFEEEQLPGIISTVSTINRRLLEITSQMEAEAVPELYQSIARWRENGVTS